VEIGVDNNLMQAREAAPLIGGAMLGVILFPMIAMRLSGISVTGASATSDRDGL
jgi:hypothetical protein